MKREAAWGAAAAIAVVAAIGISTQSTRAPGDGSVRGQGSRGGVPSPLLKAKETGRACSDAEKLLQEFLLTQKDSVAAPKVCYEDDGSAPPPSASSDLRTKASGLKFVIATLPDPLHTHFSLLFDRDAEAIQQAAQDEGYVYDSSWLPWDTEEQSFAFLNDQDRVDDRKEARENQPGIVVFRKENAEKPTSGQQPFQEGLVVFIVGEEATRGIHRRQFENAAAWIAALRPTTGNSSPIAILGPSFSGSFPSLAELLADESVHQYLKYQTSDQRLPDWQVRVYSGSVTGKSAAEWFAAVSSADPRLTGWGISFHSFLESDDAVLKSYCDYLTHSGLDTARVAVISEDETAYGFSGMQQTHTQIVPSNPDLCPGAIRLYYPRDISALRAAYQTQSIFTSGPSQQSADTQRRSLPSDLADPAGEAHDTIRAYAGNQTPLSQEAALLGIVSALRAHQAQYLVLRSSNMLDPLFLANFFRRAYPEGRVVIRGSDLLFQRERGSTGISGVMMLSTYPLFPWEQEWTTWPSAHNTPSHRVFGEDLVEGTYIAARFLLHDPAALLGERRFLPANLSAKTFVIPDYAAPFWTVPKACQAGTPKNDGPSESCTRYLRPATWLSVLGRGDFYPLAAFNEDKLAPPDLSQIQVDRISHFGAQKSDADPDKTPGQLEIPTSMKLCVILILAIGGFHVACCWKASFTAKPAFRAHFATTEGWCPYGDWRHPLLIFLGSVLIVFMAVMAAWGCGAFFDTGKPLPNVWLVRGVLVFACVVTLGAIIANNQAVWTLERDKFKDKSRAGGAVVLLLKQIKSSMLFALAVVAFWIAFVRPLELKLTIENRVPTYWRAMSVTSGVSPIVPFLGLFAGLYAWFWCSLHGLALFGLDRPRLPSIANLRLKDENGKELDVLRMFSQEVAADQTEETAIPLARGTLRLATVFFGLLAVVVLAILAWHVPVRSLGSKRYALIFCLWLDLCFSLLLAETCQLLRTWRELRQLLVFLDRMPIRRTLAALRGFSWGNVWKMSGNVLDVRYKLLSRELESLNHLKAAFDDLPLVEVLTAQGCVTAVNEAQVARQHFAEWYSERYRDPDASNFETLEAFQKSVAMLAGTLLTDILVPAWRKEKESLVLVIPNTTADQQDMPERAPLAQVSEHIRNAEELVCLPYLGFVQNILGRLRTLVLGMAWLFVAVTLSVSSYPFDPQPALSRALVFLFLALGAVISFVYADMHRDSTLSHVTNTNPGELGTEFWLKLIGLGAAPLLGLLTTVFPGLADSLFTWLQPGLASLK